MKSYISVVLTSDDNRLSRCFSAGDSMNDHRLTDDYLKILVKYYNQLFDRKKSIDCPIYELDYPFARFVYCCFDFKERLDTIFNLSKQPEFVKPSPLSVEYSNDYFSLIFKFNVNEL